MRCPSPSDAATASISPAPPRLQFADTPAGMVAAVAAALDAPRDLEAVRALARGHDWDALAGAMVTTIEARLGTAA